MSSMKLIAGNWKMNGLVADGLALGGQMASFMKGLKKPLFDMVLCPPATLIQTVADAVAGSGVMVGGQDCHAKESGAHTGDISALMLKDLGCAYVIVGHSERRQGHGETSAQVAAKAQAAIDNGLIPIICVGETGAEREAGRAAEIVSAQLRESIPPTATADNAVVAYEPVWAIGTGKVASREDIKAMHALIRTQVEEDVEEGDWLRLLYGGSVKAENAGEILHLPNVDGVLVGGASLKAEDFCAIARASGESKAA